MSRFGIPNPLLCLFEDYLNLKRTAMVFRTNEFTDEVQHLQYRNGDSHFSNPLLL